MNNTIDTKKGLSISRTVSPNNIEKILDQVKILLNKESSDKIIALFDGYEDMSYKDKKKYRESVSLVEYLFNNINNIENKTFKLNHFLAWYYIHNVLDLGKEIDVSICVKDSIIKYIKETYLDDKYSPTSYISIEQNATLHSMLHTADANIYCTGIYQDSYEKWCILMDILFDYIKEKKMI